MSGCAAHERFVDAAVCRLLYFSVTPCTGVYGPDYTGGLYFMHVPPLMLDHILEHGPGC
jgi:hypothetical protein